MLPDFKNLKLPDLPNTQKSNNTSGRKNSSKRKTTPVVDERVKVDKKTGIKHLNIPPTKFDAEGRPEISVDFDVDELDSVANQFLPHLRVPVSRDEQKVLRELRAEQRKAQNSEYKKVVEEYVAEETAKMKKLNDEMKKKIGDDSAKKKKKWFFF